MKNVFLVVFLALSAALAFESCGGDAFFDVWIKELHLGTSHDYHYHPRSQDSASWDSTWFYLDFEYEIVSGLSPRTAPQVLPSAYAIDESTDHLTVKNPIDALVISTSRLYNDSLGRNVSSWIDVDDFIPWTRLQHTYEIYPFIFQPNSPPSKEGFFDIEVTAYLNSGEVLHATLDSVYITK